MSIYIYIFVPLILHENEARVHTKGEFTIGGTNRSNRDDCEVVEESVVDTVSKTIG